MESNKECIRMKFYRYEIRQYCSMYDDYPMVSDTRIGLTTFNLHKETPCGYWIGWGTGYREDGTRRTLRGTTRWVSKTAKSRYAYPTKEEALTNFIARTKRSIEIMEARASTAKTALMIAENTRATLLSSSS